MRRLCLAVLFCVMFVSGARADRNALFVRVECNRDLGIIDVQYNNIFEGAVAYDYFEKNKGVYRYNDKPTRSDADVELLNGYFYTEPYQLYCELLPTQKYDITITANKDIDCLNDRGFIVSIARRLKETTEGQEAQRYLVKDLPIGCGSNVSRITVVPDDYQEYDDSYSYMVLEQNIEITSVFGKVKAPVNKKTVENFRLSCEKDEEETEAENKGSVGLEY